MDVLAGSVIGFVLGIAFSVALVRWIAGRVIDRIADAVAQDSQQSSDDDGTVKEMQLKLEFDQNNYFMYNVTDGSFVAQGESIAQIRQRLSERFPEYNATVVDGDPDAVAKLRKELELNPDENSNSVRSTS